MHTLLIEDDAGTSTYVRRGLEARGHRVEVEADGRRGLRRAAQGGFDVAVVDRMLPGVDGLALIRALRAASVPLPVIFLTALGGVSDRIEGLHAGADDYLIKPFDIDELDARMRAVGRRGPPAQATLVRQGAFELDRLRRRVSVDGSELALTQSEFGILDVLMEHQQQAVTKTMLLERVFDLDCRSPDMIIEPHVSRLRAKIVAAGGGDPIRTLRGRGYRFHAG